MMNATGLTPLPPGPSLEQHATQPKDLARKDSLVLPFESAADAIAGGDVDLLKALLRENPTLIRTRSDTCASVHAP